MDDGRFLGDDFTAAVIAAGEYARLETLAAGVPVFYLDRDRNVDIMEQPDGRMFKIRFIPGAPRDRNFEVLREITNAAA
jgi:hypothetical protein